MKIITTLALSACLATAFAGAGFAQSSASSNMGNMSDSDKAMMTKCKGMSESMMKADKDCMAMMKKHPEMGTTGAASGSNNTGAGSQNKTLPSNQK